MIIFLYHKLKVVSFGLVLKVFKLGVALHFHGFHSVNMVNGCSD